MLDRFEEYLDGGLDAAGRLEVEALVAADATAAKRLSSLRAQRALRVAVYDSYLPTPHEASALAARMLADAYDAPAGRIGHWVRRGAAVAAAVMIVAGTFAVGRMTASPQKQFVDRVEVHTVYNVVYSDSLGDQNVREFATMEERNSFVQELQQRGVASIQLAESTLPGHL